MWLLIENSLEYVYEVIKGIPYLDFKVETIIAVVRKIQTATKDRRLNLGSPHSPCPLVQPFDNLVPNPTKKPEIINPR